MAQKAPGRHDRKGIYIMELFDMFPDERMALEWFERTRWEARKALPLLRFVEHDGTR